MSENLDRSLHSAQLAYLNVLAGKARPGEFLDVRWRSPTIPMRRRFVSVGRLGDAARLITTLAAANDVYVGVALRDGARHGGRSAVPASHLAFLESDANTAERLVSFSHPPSMVVASGVGVTMAATIAMIRIA